MKKVYFLFILFSIHFPIFTIEVPEKTLVVSSGKIIFLSEAPQETIKGIGKLITGKVSFETKNVQFEIDLRDWKTSNKLQTSHLQENYLETDTFPKAKYSGSLESFDTNTGKANVKGILELHGVKKENVTIEGILEKQSNGYLLKTNFKILLTDYNIKIPKLLILKVSNEVNLSAEINLIKGNE